MVDCDTEPGGCFVGVLVVPDGGGPEVGVWAPVSFMPPLTPVPNRNLADGDTVAVSVNEVPAGEWSVAQCAVTDPTQDASGTRRGAVRPLRSP